MPLRAKRRAAKREILVRDVQVTVVRIGVTVTAERTPNSVPHQQASSQLVIVGELTESLQRQTQIELRIYATEAQLGNKDPPAFGVIGVGEALIRVGAFIRREHWKDVWTLASAGMVKYCRIAFTAPTDDQGLVTRLDVSSAPVED